MISYIKFASTPSLNPFVRMLFSNDSPLTTVPYHKLNYYIGVLLNEVCTRFVDNVKYSSFLWYYDTEVPETEELLIWFRLLLYTKHWTLDSLLEYLCSESQRKDKAKNHAVLRKLLAHEDFRTQPRFQAVRVHPTLIEWKKRMQKESFNKLFLRLPNQSTTSSTDKRNFPEADDLSNSPKKSSPFQFTRRQGRIEIFLLPIEKLNGETLIFL